MSWAMPDGKEAYYPMPAFPMLRVSDPAASARWYQEVLDFLHVFTAPGPGGRSMLVHLRWVKYADLLLVPEDEPPAEPHGLGVSLYFNFVDERLESLTVDALAERARAAGATIVHGPADRAWNTREVTIADPDGYHLTFSRVINRGLGWEALGRQITGERSGGK
jgi:uncharacterized glyoxalase superfamily protein PhnB